MQEHFVATALKYRPQKFSDLVGQEHVSRSLGNAIKNKRVSHAYLFSGPRGVGKTSAARIMAKSLNCEIGPTLEPCLECKNCQEITAGNSLDVYEVDGASNNSVDQIRELRNNVKFPPTSARYKIYIIDEVHMLTTAAFNALLKTLEEPPPYVIFIFATTEPSKVKITIRSRCQHYRFKRIASIEITNHLKKIVDLEGVNPQEDALFKIAKVADGSMRDAQSLLDQTISYGGFEFTNEHVMDLAGMIDSSLYFDFLTNLLEKDVRSILKKMEEMEIEGIDFSDFVFGLADTLSNLILLIEGSSATELDMVREDYEILKIFYDPSSVDGFSEDDIILLQNILIDLSVELKSGREPFRIMSLYVFKLVNFRNMVPPEKIMQRIDELYSQIMGVESGNKGTPFRKRGAISLPIEMYTADDDKVSAEPAKEPAISPASVAPENFAQSAPNERVNSVSQIATSVMIEQPRNQEVSSASLQPPIVENDDLQEERVGFNQSSEPVFAKKPVEDISSQQVQPQSFNQQAAPVVESQPQSQNLQPKQVDAVRLFQDLLAFEENANPVTKAVLQNVVNVAIEGTLFLFYFPQKDSFYSNQVVNEKEQILSFLVEKTGVNFDLDVRFNDSLSQLLPNQNLHADVNQNANQNTQNSNNRSEVVEQPSVMADKLKDAFNGEFV